MIVSICIPVYCVQDYIERCVRSLFEQSYPNIEYIFVDDCSPDNSIRILENLIDEYNVCSKCCIIHHEENQGIAATRNTAIANAHGDYIIWVDSDDWVEKDTVEKLVEKQVSTKADIVNFNVIIHNTGNTVINNQQLFNSVSEFSRGIITRTVPYELWGRMIKKELYSSEVRCLPGINIAEDWLMMVKLLPNTKSVCSISDPLYHYDRTRPTSLTRVGGEYVERKAWEAFCDGKHYLENKNYETDSIREAELRLSAVSLFNYAKWPRSEYFHAIALAHITSENLKYINALSKQQRIVIHFRNNKSLLKLFGAIWHLRQRLT